MSEKPIALHAASVALRPLPAKVPEPFRPLFDRRDKRVLGDLFGLSNFGVNLVTLAPGGRSSLRHAHATQDEFIYVLAGRPILITDRGETALEPGMCAGFPAGTGDAHHLLNRTDQAVTYLEIGDRSPHDKVTYPEADLYAEADATGAWLYMRKDGTPY